MIENKKNITSWKNIISSSENIEISPSTYHVGHLPIPSCSITGWNPSVCTFLLGERNKISLLNPHSTIENFIRAMLLIASILSKGGKILLVSTHPDYSRHLDLFVQRGSKDVVFYHSQWVGGSLTNFHQISRIISTLTLFSKKISRFMRKNNLVSSRFQKMAQSFSGFLDKNIHQQKPDLIFLINPVENNAVVREAQTLKIPVIAVTTSIAETSQISCAIPGNSESLFFIHLFLFWIIRISNGNIFRNK